jgi:DNA-binding CsgD family transcriptional regulator
MNKRIGIIHRSEIIRKGLATLIRSFFNLEFHHFSGPESLIRQKEILASLSCIIIESHFLLNFNPAKFKINDELKIISYIDTTEVSPIPGEDEIITSFTSSTEIQKIISRCLKSKDQRNASYSGSELSTREQDVLKLIALGHSNKEIAELLFISIHTVISHRKNITEKLGIKSIPGLTVYAILNKLIDTDNIKSENLI